MARISNFYISPRLVQHKFSIYAMLLQWKPISFHQHIGQFSQVELVGLQQNECRLNPKICGVEMTKEIVLRLGSGQKQNFSLVPFLHVAKINFLLHS